MRRIGILLLAAAMGVTGLLVVAQPAQAALSDCTTHLSFGALDTRIQWSPSNGYWKTRKYRSSYGNCNGVYIIHQGHWGAGEGDQWNGSYRIRTFYPDGVTINYTGPWRNRSVGVYYNMRPEISNGRIFEIHERATPCLLSDCSIDHWPMFGMSF